MIHARKHWRIPTAFFALSMLVVLFGVGCDKNKAAQQTEQGIILAVPNWYAPENLPAMKAVIDRWNQSDAGHKQPIVVHKVLGKREAVLQKIMLGASRERWADLVLVRNEWIGVLAERSLIRPFPDDLAEQTQGLLLPALVPAVTYRDQVWGAPYDADVQVIWVRKDLLPTQLLGIVGWSVAGLENLIAELQKEKLAGRLESAFAFPANQSAGAALSFLPWYFSGGGKLMDIGGNLVLDDLVAQRTIMWMLSLQQEGWMPKNMGSLEQWDVFTGIAGGAFGSALGGSWERPMFEKRSKLADKIVSLTVPGFDPGKGKPIIGGWSLVLLQNGNPEAPTAVLAFLSRDAQEQKLVENGYLPTNNFLLENSWFANSHDGRNFKQSLAQGVALPMHPKLTAALEQISLMITQTYLGKEKSEEAVTAAKKAITALNNE